MPAELVANIVTALLFSLKSDFSGGNDCFILSLFCFTLFHYSTLAATPIDRTLSKQLDSSALLYHNLVSRISDVDLWKFFNSDVKA